MAYTPAVEQWRGPLSGLFPASEIDKLLHVIQYESGGNPGSVGDNGASYGLFQSQSPRGSIGDPTAQIQDAYNRWKARGYRDWGENNSYQGKKFGALGNHPYPGGAGGGGTGGGPAPGFAPTAPGFDPAQFEALKQAVIGAGNIQSPASPLGDHPELANLYKSSFQLPQSQMAAGAISNIGQDQIDYQKKADAAAKKLEEDMSDFSKYKQVQKDDGGYDFFDPLGNQVDIATLSQRTGKRPAEIVQDSQNPIDQQYLQDYTRLKDYGQAFYDSAKGDKAAIKIIEQYNQQDKNLKKLFDEFGNKSPDEYLGKVRDLFFNHYKRYYIPRTQDPTAWGTTPSRPLFANQQNFPLSDYGFAPLPVSNTPSSQGGGTARFGAFPGGGSSGGARGY